MWPPLAYCRLRRVEIESRVEDGDECRRVGDLLQHAIEVLDDCRGPAQLSSPQAKNDCQRRHEKRGCGAFAGDVRNDDVDKIVGDAEEIVVIAAEEPRGLHCRSQIEAGNDGRLGKNLALDLGGQYEVSLVVVALLADLHGQTAPLACDRRDEKSDGEVAGQADDGAYDLQVKRVEGRAEELLQKGAEHRQRDGDGDAVDQRTERDRQNVEVAERIVLHDDLVRVGNGADGQNDEEIEKSRSAVLDEKEPPALVVTVLIALEQSHLNLLDRFVFDRQGKSEMESLQTGCTMTLVKVQSSINLLSRLRRGTFGASAFQLESWLSFLQFGGLPGVEAAGEVGDVAEAGAAEDAGRDRTAIAALAMDHDEFRWIELACVFGELTERNSDGVFERSGLNLAGLAHVKDGEVALLFFLEVCEFLQGDLRDVVELVAGFVPAVMPSAR